jgi:hypothetical protein
MLPRLRDATKPISSPPNSFHLFPRLPPELRLKIWNYTITTSSFVPVRWSQSQRVFLSTRKPPTILHICQESRIFGLKTYTLSFASSPEFARIYFSFEDDVVFFDWGTLGAIPGRLGRKLGDEECMKIRYMLIKEATLLEHCDENLRELEKFIGLKRLVVVCDVERPETGDCYGLEEMSAIAVDLDGDLEGDMDGEENYHTRDQWWPQLECLRDEIIEEGEAQCSRHWWFEGWNKRAMIKQGKTWPEAMAICFQSTRGGDEDSDDDYDAGFLFNLLFYVAENPLD